MSFQFREIIRTLPGPCHSQAEQPIIHVGSLVVPSVTDHAEQSRIIVGIYTRATAGPAVVLILIDHFGLHVLKRGCFRALIPLYSRKSEPRLSRVKEESYNPIIARHVHGVDCTSPALCNERKVLRTDVLIRSMVLV